MLFSCSYCGGGLELALLATLGTVWLCGWAMMGRVLRWLRGIMR